MAIKILLCILFLGIIIPTAIDQPHVEYLKGVERLKTSNFTNYYFDYYFSCTLTGHFLQWLYNDVPLSGFRIPDAGRVVVITRPTYNYTATLLSSQLDPETNQRRLDSVLVLSFNGNRPNSFEVTCSSNSDFSTIQVDGIRGNTMSNSSSNGVVVLDHIISTEIVQNKNRTHIFICGAQNDQHYYEILGSRTIGFNEYDNVGQDRTDLSQDGNLVNIQGVLIAQLPNQKTSLLFITENPDVTVICFFGTNQAVLNSNQVVPKESNRLLPPLHTAPVTTTTTNSSASHATTVQPSTAYGTDGAGFTGSSSAVAVTVGIILVLSVLLCVAVPIIVVTFIKKRKTPINQSSTVETPEDNTSDSAYGSNSSSDETGCYSSSDETPDKEDACMALDVVIETYVSLKREDTPMAADLEAIAVGEDKLEHESDSLSRHTSEIIQYSVEESSSGDAQFRICESSIHRYGHEHGGLESVKSFGSLQEAVFIGADGLGQSYWNASVSGSPVVMVEENSDAEDRDALYDVHIMEEDKDALDHVPGTGKDKDTLDNAPVTEKDQDALDDVPGTEKSKNAHGNVHIMEDDKHAESDKRVCSGFNYIHMSDISGVPLYPEVHYMSL